jgi:hypothetical protein
MHQEPLHSIKEKCACPCRLLTHFSVTAKFQATLSDQEKIETRNRSNFRQHTYSLQLSYMEQNQKYATLTIQDPETRKRTEKIAKALPVLSWHPNSRSY